MLRKVGMLVVILILVWFAVDTGIAQALANLVLIAISLVSMVVAGLLAISTELVNTF